MACASRLGRRLSLVFHLNSRPRPPQSRYTSETSFFFSSSMLAIRNLLTAVRLPCHCSVCIAHQLVRLPRCLSHQASRTLPRHFGTTTRIKHPPRQARRGLGGKASASDTSSTSPLSLPLTHPLSIAIYQHRSRLRERGFGIVVGQLTVLYIKMNLATLCGCPSLRESAMPFSSRPALLSWITSWDEGAFGVKQLLGLTRKMEVDQWGLLERGGFIYRERVCVLRERSKGNCGGMVVGRLDRQRKDVSEGPPGKREDWRSVADG